MQPALRMARSFRTIGFVLVVASFLPPEALAQVPPPATQPAQPGQQVEPERRPGQPPPPPRQPAEIEKPAAPARPARKREGPKVLVKKFRVTGNTVIPSEELEALVRSEEGKELTLDELREVAGRITDYYASKGYILARAYLPPQDVREGVIEISVLEGMVGNIEVTGNKRYKSEVITRALTRFRNAQVVNEPLLETAINNLNDYPGLNVRASLKPGEKPGSTDVVMTAQERLPISFLADVDNYGSRFTGPWRYGAELGVGNLAGQGDNLTFRGIKSNHDLNYVRTSYLIPVGGYGTKVGPSYVHSENGVGQEFAPLQAAGRLDIVSVDIFQPLLRTDATSVQLAGGFDYKLTQNFLLGTRSAKDDVRLLRLSVSGDHRDRFLGRTSYGLTGYRGGNLFGGTKQDELTASRPNGPGTFKKATLDLARVQSLVYGGSYVILRGFGQLASNNLLTGERYAIGGYYTVRGYPIAELQGDHAYTLSAEVVIPVQPLRERLQLAAFIDNGGVVTVSPNKEAGEKERQIITGAGVGLRFNLPVSVPGFGKGTWRMRVDYAWALGAPRPTSRKNGITEGKPGILYFTSSFGF